MINREWLIKNFQPCFFYIFFFLFILSFNVTAQDYDYDLWARLIIGKFIVQTGHVLKYDFLSYTPTHTLYDHEWGSSVIFYLTQHIFSHVGLLLLQVILTFLIYLVIIKIIKLRGITTTHPYNFVFYFFSLSAISMGQIADQIIRCQIFTFLFFTIYLYILEMARKDQNKPLWLLPIIMIIWNNMHGGCIAGIGLVVIYIIGEFINKKPIKKFFLPLLFTISVLPINPWGFDYITFLIKATTMPRPEITEWLGLFNPIYVNTYLEFKFFALIMILAEIAFILRSYFTKKLNFDATKILAVGVTLFLAIEHVKFIPISVITISALLYDDFYTIFNLITRNILKKASNFKDILIYTLFSIFIIFNFTATKITQQFVSWNKYPLRAIEFVKINNLRGNLFINFGLGSYASYKLYPNNKIFIDGRYEEAYYDYMLPMINRFLNLGKNSDELMNKFNTDVFILEKGFPICEKMNNDSKWTLVFEDRFYEVYVKTKDLKKKYLVPSDELNYYRKTLFDTDIDFRGKQWQKK